MHIKVPLNVFTSFTNDYIRTGKLSDISLRTNKLLGGGKPQFPCMVNTAATSPLC